MVAGITGITKKQVTKKQLRALMLARRDGFTGPSRRHAEDGLRRRLVHSALWKRAGRVGLTISVGSELDTRPLLCLARKEGRSVVVPRITGPHRMDFLPLTATTCLIPDNFGIPEPTGEEAVDPRSIGLLLIPGLAFTAAGDRLGYGGGFYDAWTGAHPRVPTVALAFSWQVFDRPCWRIDAWDRRVGTLLHA